MQLQKSETYSKLLATILADEYLGSIIVPQMFWNLRYKCKWAEFSFDLAVVCIFFEVAQKEKFEMHAN